MKFDPFGEDNFYTLSPDEAELSEDRVTAVREAVAAAHPYVPVHYGERGI